MKTYDVVIIGSGPGGYIAAIRCAQLGLKTCCIEKDKTLGGTCLNVGCIPSKDLLHSSELYWKMKHESSHYGIHMKDLSFNLQEMMLHKEKTIAGFTKGIEFLFKNNKVDWIQGTAYFKSPREISVGEEMITASSIILAAGSTPIELPFLPFDEKKILSSTGALSLSSPPKKLLIVGAGVIGVELGSVYQRLGSEVVFLEFLDRICSPFDLALSKALQKSLVSQGMVFHLSHKVLRADLSHGVSLTAQGPSGEISFSADAALVAVGRKPLTQPLRLENAKVALDAKGFISIDASFRTSQPHIFAIGDLVEGPMLAHKASQEGIAVAELIAGQLPTLDYFSIPNVIYTSPEAASVGLTEEEVKERKLPYRASTAFFKTNSRARCTGEEEGFVKILAEEKSRKILGVHILGAHASELIAEAVFAIAKRATADELAAVCHAHPTLSETLWEAASALFKTAVH